MATSKTLKPTNVTIFIPEFTDQPDQRVNSNCIEKLADAINGIVQYSDTTITTGPNGTATLSGFGRSGRVILGIYNDRSNSDYETSATIFVPFASGSANLTGNTTVLAIDVINFTPAASKTFSVRVYYLDL